MYISLIQQIKLTHNITNKTYFALVNISKQHVLYTEKHFLVFYVAYLQVI